MEELFNGLMSKETANKLKEILKDVPEPKEEVKPEKEKKVKNKKEVKKEDVPFKKEPKGETKEANNTGEGEIRVNSLNLAMAVKFLTLVKYTTVSNKDEKTKHKYKNYFLFKKTKSVEKALEVLNILKPELRKEALETMKEGNK